MNDHYNAIGDAPDNLSPEATTIWNNIVAEQIRGLNKSQRQWLAATCRVASRLQFATQFLNNQRRRKGVGAFFTPAGKRNAMVDDMLDFLDALNKYLEEFECEINYLNPLVIAASSIRDTVYRIEESNA